jgi:hypothetical protein
MSTASPLNAGGKSSRRRVPLLAVLLVCGLIWVIVCAVFVVRVARRMGFFGGPGPAVTISRETTHIVQPLREDGYVDYFAALNQRSREGVTAENNAAVLLWQAVGPAAIVACYGEEGCDGFFRELGVPRPADDGEYFLSQWVYASRIEGDPPREEQPESTADEWGGPVDESPTWTSILGEQSARASERPWSAEEFPKLAEWLEANRRPLALVVEASAKERFYSPLIPADKSPTLRMARLPSPQAARQMCGALQTRAMLRLHQGKIDEAWSDLLACHRWARLVAQGPMYLEIIIAHGIDAVACSGDAALAHHGSLTSEHARRLRADLDQLARLPGWFDRIDPAERFTFLDGVTAVAREGLGVLDCSRDKESRLESLIWQFGGNETLDWDAILRAGNALFDRLVEIGEIPDPLGKSLLKSGPRRAVSEKLGQLWLALLTAPSAACWGVEDRGVMIPVMAKLSLALAAYRSDRGSYPDALGQLVPEYVKEVPEDPYSGDALRYAREGEDYVLYSVGPNGQDEQGRDYQCEPEGDDVAVRTAAAP